MKPIIYRFPGENEIASFELTLPRVSLFMGANGSGKSRILRNIFEQIPKIFGPDFSTVFVEGGRAFQGLAGTTKAPAENTALYPSLNKFRAEYRESARNLHLSNRVNSVFPFLKAIEIEEKQRHSDEVCEWFKNEMKDEKPIRNRLPFERLSSTFENLFPNLKLEFSINEELIVKNTRNGAIYGINQLSDGEKQVLSFLADLIASASENTVFLIDEPEQNLNPSLAADFWTTIEAEFPKSYFVYASHSFQFASREQIQLCYLLGIGKLDKEDFWTDDYKNELYPFMSALPSILKQKKCLFIEGTVSSFDATFYSWLLRDCALSIVPVQSSSNVISACKGEFVWKSLFGKLEVAGIVDRDYSKRGKNQKNLAILPFHEVESYLCDVELLLCLAKILGKEINSDAIEFEILRFAQATQFQLLERRLAANCSFNLSVSISRERRNQPSGLDEVRETILSNARQQLEYATTRLSDEHLAATLDKLSEEISQALNSKNLNAILELFEGKELLLRISQSLFASPPMNLLRTLADSQEPKDFKRLKDLHSLIASLYQS